MIIPVIIGTVLWLLAMILAAGALVGTVGVAAGRRIQRGEDPTAERPAPLLLAHLSFFPAVLLALIGGWGLALAGAWTLAYVCLLLPLLSVGAFGWLLWRG